MLDNHPPPSVRNRVEEGTQARGYRHHLAIPGGGGGRPVLSVYRDGDLSNCPQPRGARRDGCLILPFGNRQELSVLRDGDGKFFTENPLLGGPYSRLEDVFRAASLLFRDRTQTQVVAQDGRPNRPRGARQCSSLVLTRYRPRNRPRRTRRAPSPALTEDLRLPPLPSESDKLVVAATAFASGLTLLEPDVSSSDELLDTTSSELITASAQTVPHNTTDGSPSGHCYSASSGPTIWVRNPPGWYFMFFVRMDRGGSFHMYPDMGGPFRSLKEAEDFIDRHIDKLRRKAMCNEQDDLPYLEKLIRRCVFYPDGTPKRGPNAPGRKNPNYRELQLVQAILDQYNDDHSLFGDFAHELNSDISFQWIPEATTRYYHFNFTTKTKEAGDVYRGTGNLFFAEVSQMQRDGDWVLSCCRMIEPSDNGQCYGCSRDESPDIKHPNNSNEYAGGHENKYMGFGGDPFSDSDDDEEAQVAKLRRKFKGLDRAFNKEKTKCGNEATLVKS